MAKCITLFEIMLNMLQWRRKNTILFYGRIENPPEQQKHIGKVVKSLCSSRSPSISNTFVTIKIKLNAHNVFSYFIQLACLENQHEQFPRTIYSNMLAKLWMWCKYSSINKWNHCAKNNRMRSAKCYVGFGLCIFNLKLGFARKFIQDNLQC